MKTLLLSAALLAIVPAAAVGQSLSSRVASVRNGPVMFQYNPRPGVCGDGDSFMRIGHSYHGSYSRYTKSAPCDFGPVLVRLTLQDGVVDYVETWVGRIHKREGRDLGMVSAREAASYLLQVASETSGRSSSSKAITGAVIADSATVWPALLKIARAREGRSRGGSKDEAVFWLSQFAASALTGHPNDLFFDDDKDDEDDVKSHAVFVLSQLPGHGGYDELVNVAKNNKDPRVRSKALFWLGQGGDSRAIDLFEQILTK